MASFTTCSGTAGLGAYEGEGEGAAVREGGRLPALEEGLLGAREVF